MFLFQVRTALNPPFIGLMPSFVHVLMYGIGSRFDAAMQQISHEGRSAISPERARRDSPGQRPGSAPPNRPIALKGRGNIRHYFLCPQMPQLSTDIKSQ